MLNFLLTNILSLADVLDEINPVESQTWQEDVESQFVYFKLSKEFHILSAGQRSIKSV